MVAFVKAEKKQAKLRLAIDGPSGSGKTYTALIAATALARGGKIAVIDTERGSASLYADQFEFDVAELNTFSPQNYIDAIDMAEKAGYAVVVIDSLSHAWEGEGGALDMVDAATARSQSKNSYFAWRDVTPLHRKLVDAMLQSKCHIIATMRSKTEYVIEEVERNGKKTQIPRKVGTAPIQRAGMEYEFTIVGDMDLDHRLVISKSRMASLADDVVVKPDAKWFGQIVDWLNSGAPASEPQRTPDPQTQPAAATPPQKPAEYRQAQPPKAKANGAKPANGNGKRADSDKPTKDDLVTFDQLCTEAEGLGIDTSSIINSPYADTLGSLRGAYALVKELIKDARQPAPPEEPPAN